MKLFLRFTLIISKIYIGILISILNNLVLNNRIRARLYNIFHPNIHLGKNVKLRKNTSFYAGSNLDGKLTIGNNAFINEECFLDFSGEIIMEDNVSLGMRVMILSSTHKIGQERRSGQARKKLTTIKENCWIGAGAIIYPGITIGVGSVIAAGEVVYQDIPSNKLLKKGILIDIYTDTNK